MRFHARFTHIQNKSFLDFINNGQNEGVIKHPALFTQFKRRFAFSS